MDEKVRVGISSQETMVIVLSTLIESPRMASSVLFVLMVMWEVRRSEMAHGTYRHTRKYTYDRSHHHILSKKTRMVLLLCFLSFPSRREQSGNDGGELAFSFSTMCMRKSLSSDE